MSSQQQQVMSKPKQISAFAMYCMGASRAQIADKLLISIHTVKKWSTIYQWRAMRDGELPKLHDKYTLLPATKDAPQATDNKGEPVIVDIIEGAKRINQNPFSDSVDKDDEYERRHGLGKSVDFDNKATFDELVKLDADEQRKQRYDEAQREAVQAQREAEIRAVYEDLIGALEEKGIMTPTYLSIVDNVIYNMRLINTYKDDIEREGTFYMTASGLKKENPAINTLDKAQKAVVAQINQLSLSADKTIKDKPKKQADLMDILSNYNSNK